MVEGLFAAAAGMAAQQDSLNAISNDIANANTDGYQAERVGFRDLLYTPAGTPSGASVATGSGAAASQIGTSQVQGPMDPTGNKLDLALNGPGFFEVRQSDGSIGLTRNGALTLDNRGQLTAADGSVVQPPITVPSAVSQSDITVTSNGTVRAAGRTLGRLAIVTVPAPDQLTPSGNTTYTPNAATGALRAVTGTTVQQGALEGSNVNVNDEMTQMISAENGYSLDSEAIKMQQQMMQTADQVKTA